MNSWREAEPSSDESWRMVEPLLGSLGSWVVTAGPALSRVGLAIVWLLGLFTEVDKEAEEDARDAEAERFRRGNARR